MNDHDCEHCYYRSDKSYIKDITEINSKINLIISLIAEDDSNLVRASVQNVEASRFDEYKPPKGMKVEKITIGRFI